MAPAMATARLRKELVKLQKEPPPGIIAEPDEKNILKWHYAIRGPKDTGFENGIYVGKLIFPTEYPMKGPSIYMLTPSGRFQINTKLCMSMSDFHPESWNPLWSVSSIIQGIQSFMASDELTTGGLQSPKSEHVKLAQASMDYNTKMFPTLFGGDIVSALNLADQARETAEAEAAAKSKQQQSSSSSSSVKKSSNRSSKTRKDNGNNATATTTDADDTSKEATTTNNSNTQEVELTPEEMEKRKKKNAKKRAKQKAKKAAAQKQSQEGDDENQDDDDDGDE